MNDSKLDQSTPITLAQAIARLWAGDTAKSTAERAGNYEAEQHEWQMQQVHF